MERDPSSGDVDEPFVLLETPVVELGSSRLACSQPPLVQEPSEQDSVGEDVDSVLRANGRHAAWVEDSTVEDGGGDLVGGESEARVDEEEEMSGVGVGESELIDLGRGGGLERLEMAEEGA